MSEQTKILDQLQILIMEILKTGSASVEQGNQLDTLEAELEKQKCFQNVEGNTYASFGDEIARLFFATSDTQAIAKLHEYDITPEDFFGFADYFYDEGEEEALVETLFTDAFRQKVADTYQAGA